MKDPTTHIFHELDYRLSVVPRWVILNTIQKQSVAEHCFNVERIARRIAVDWFDIGQLETLDEISQWALNHDNEEAFVGDIPGPNKHMIKEEYLDRHHAAWYSEDSPIYQIVKLADMLEAYWFLAMEIAMGNRYVCQHRDSMMQEMLNFAESNWQTIDVGKMVEEWAKEVTRYHRESRTYD